MLVMDIRLEDWQLDIVDAEAAACGVTRHEMLRKLFVDGVAHELRDMDPPSPKGDGQWKSH